ncbi:MAG: NTP transferase domain-containing protein [Nocardioidaceae bacterium]
MRCVVLAAGCGSRLGRGRSKLLEPVCGVALVEQLIATTARVGVDDFLVVTGYQAARVEGAYLDEHGLDAAFDDYAGFEPGWSKDRQVELLAERHGLSRDRVLFVGDSPRDAQLLRRTGVHSWASTASSPLTNSGFGDCRASTTSPHCPGSGTGTPAGAWRSPRPRRGGRTRLVPVGDAPAKRARSLPTEGCGGGRLSRR